MKFAKRRNGRVALGAHVLGSLTIGMAISATPAIAAEQAQVAGKKVEHIEVNGEYLGYNTRKVQSGKFTDDLLNSAKTVTVINQDLIKDMGAQSFTDALRATPGITLGTGEGGNPYGDRPFIRGYDAQSSTFINGMRDVGSQSRETFNIEQIEVLKGPSSVYNGRGAVGGSINIVTKKAQAEDFINADVAIGTDALKRASLDVNHVIADEAAVRVNLMAHDANTPGRDEVSGNRWGIAPSVTFGLTTPTKVTLEYYHFENHDIPDYGIPYEQATGKPADVDPNNFYGLLSRDFRDNNDDTASVLISHDFNNDMQFTSTSVYSRNTNYYIVTNPDDTTGNVANGYVWRNTKSRHSVTKTLATQLQLAGEAKLAGFTNRFAIGTEFSNERTSNLSYTVDTGNGRNAGCNDALLANYNCTLLSKPNPHDPWVGSVTLGTDATVTETDTRSVYAFNTIELNESWMINGGVRWDDYSTAAQNSTSSLSNDDDFLNYQLSVLYKPAVNGSIYAAWGTSSNPPGTSNGDGSDRLGSNNEDLKPEDTESYELGTKWDFFSGRLSLNGSVFQIEKNNARVATSADRNSPQENVGEQKVKGFEIGFSGDITEHWHGFGGYTYLDASLESNGFNAAYDGNRFPNTAKNSISLFTTYDITEQLNVGTGAYYMGQVYGNTANTLSIPSYWRFDVVSSYKMNDFLTLRLNVQNLTDERYYDKAYTAHFANMAPGRLVMLSADMHF
ncbi:TonB-dependent siderophore receptor [Shewanella baltica]|uniref:TonB-dependent receptor n=1 Tax=Shewanella baltica TaxID=62322 RepID=UPI00217D6C05|nr:TonB-dependent siderophore receptor [Shewanella baltica]MCS6129247.1 TonB-dependent siderophore receptor [Shewanella baltica]MCS6141239.1 TonB-dependent siderophore receptor [Shewanella baltica]MCS6147523.1 TonB-dependent siderophore receptor [Shewanella baltica]MCS6172052.1 TonB-dependent siderophore receptor [Shewanella baltica]MCS6189215.1 TonB-dependent siderophore receptor [Shewanella baltica]